jgi:hypothetical protein
MGGFMLKAALIFLGLYSSAYCGQLYGSVQYSMVEQTCYDIETEDAYCRFTDLKFSTLFKHIHEVDENTETDVFPYSTMNKDCSVIGLVTMNTIGTKPENASLKIVINLMGDLQGDEMEASASSRYRFASFDEIPYVNVSTWKAKTVRRLNNDGTESIFTYQVKISVKSEPEQYSDEQIRVSDLKKLEGKHHYPKPFKPSSQK